MGNRGPGLPVSSDRIRLEWPVALGVPACGSGQPFAKNGTSASPSEEVSGPQGTDKGGGNCRGLGSIIKQGRRHPNPLVPWVLLAGAVAVLAGLAGGPGCMQDSLSSLGGKYSPLGHGLSVWQSVLWLPPSGTAWLQADLFFHRKYGQSTEFMRNPELL